MEQHRRNSADLNKGVGLAKDAGTKVTPSTAA